MKPEHFPLVLNLCIFLRYLWQWEEPGKILYWAGATILTLGLLQMRG